MSIGGYGTNMYGLRADQLFQIQTAFHQFDADHNGFITLDEMRQCLHRSGIAASDFEVYQTLSKMDYNHDGQISYDEYMKFMARVYRGERP